LGLTGLQRGEAGGAVDGAQQLGFPSGARGVVGEQTGATEGVELHLVLDAEPPRLAQDVPGAVANRCDERGYVYFGTVPAAALLIRLRS
jgi:hypothetical protein